MLGSSSQKRKILGWKDGEDHRIVSRIIRPFASPPCHKIMLSFARGFSVYNFVAGSYLCKYQGMFTKLQNDQYIWSSPYRFDRKNAALEIEILSRTLESWTESNYHKLQSWQRMLMIQEVLLRLRRKTGEERRNRLTATRMKTTRTKFF